MSDKAKNFSLINAELPESVDNAVKNLTDRPSQSIGQTLSDLWQLALGGRVAYAAEKRRIKYAHDLNVYRQTLEAKVAAIPKDKQIDPPLQIAAQALDDSKYCVESKELRNMFASLIANSMNSDLSYKIHPSFSKIIQQLSPMDARMLHLIATAENYGGMAIVDYIEIDIKAKFNYRILAEKIPAALPNDCSEAAASQCIDSLIRLGLIKIPENSQLNDDCYLMFIRSHFYEQLKSIASTYRREVGIQKRYARLTSLGQDFVSVCLG